MTDWLADVAEIEARGEIEGVAFCLASRRAGVPAAAAAALARLFAAVPVGELPGLDRRMRGRNEWEHPDWATMQPAALDSFWRFGPAAGAAFAAASFHPNGRVREAAVLRLAAMSDGGELPFLLLRANDWVGRIAAAALAAVEGRLRPECAAQLIAVLPLLENFARHPLRRSRLAALHAEAAAVLRGPAAAGFLLTGFRAAADRKDVRRAILAVAAGSAAMAELIEPAMADPDPVVRIRGARGIASLADPAVRRRLMAAAADDRLTVVRLAAYLALFSNASPAAVAAAIDIEAALLDPLPMIRYCARDVAASCGSHDDFAAFYRRALAAGTRPVGSLAGLADTGTVADVALVEPWLRHPSPRLRVAAVGALARLDAPAYVALFLDLIGRDSPSVGRAAAQALAAKAPLVRTAQLRDAFAATPENRRKFLWPLLDRHPKWDRLPLLLLGAYGAPPDHAARVSLHNWWRSFNRSYRQADSGQVAAIRDALDAVRARMEPGAVRAVEHLVRGGDPRP